MRVALIIPSFYPATVYGGPIFATLHAAQAIARLGMDVDVISTNANGDTRLTLPANTYISQEPHLRVKYYNETIIGRLSLPLLFRSWRDIARSDVVHVQSIFSTPTPIALIYAKLLRKPIVLSPRGSLCQWCLKERAAFKQKWLKFLITPFIKHITWHATSKAEADDIQTLYPEANVQRISDGVNVNEYQHANTLSKQAFIEKYAPDSTDATAQHSAPIIISMGRLHKVKGFDILINAFTLIHKEMPDALLIIAGNDDGELTALQALVRSHQLEHAIHFCGALHDTDKIDFLANADLFVLPSHTENFGIVYAEALAAGTPIVASTNTPWQAVETAGCGKWVDNSVTATADAMRSLLDGDAKQLHQNAKTFAQSFDWNDIAKQFETLFHRL